MVSGSHLNRGAAVVLALVVVLMLVACGGGSPTDSSNGSASIERSKEFISKGPNGVLAKMGEESTSAEREAASRLIEEMERAREDKNWSGQCETLATQFARRLAEGAPKGGPKTCARYVKSYARGVKQQILDSTMIEPIAALRVDGNRAFAFYHGAGGKKYVIPLEKDHGEWRLGALSELELS